MAAISASSQTDISSSLVSTLHQLAASLRGGGGVEALVPILNRAFAELPGTAELRVDAEADRAGFSHQELAAPLYGNAGRFGMMRVTPGPGGSFDASQMQIAGAVANLAAVVLDNSFQARAASSSADFLNLVLGDAELGVACYRSDGSLLFSNASVDRLLGNPAPVDWSSVAAALSLKSDAADGTTRVFPTQNAVVQASVRSPAVNQPGVLVLSDMTPRLAVFRESFLAEVYKSMVLRSRLTLGLVVGEMGCHRLVQLLESSRSSFPSGVRIGPVDGRTAGIVAVDTEPSVVWRGIRTALAACAGEPFSAGVASLDRAADTPEALMQRARDSLQSLPALNRPGLLVVDRSLSVSETLALILRNDFSVTCVNDPSHGNNLLSGQPFDGVIFELPSRNDSGDAEILRRARELQPSARPFFTTELPGPWDLSGFGLPQVPVFRKPFVVRDLRDSLRAALKTDTAPASN